MDRLDRSGVVSPIRFSPPGESIWLAVYRGAYLASSALGQSDEEFKGVIGTTVADSVPDFPPPPQPRAGAPNVVYILLDDVGFADLGCYGSEIQTPSIDQLAENGPALQQFSHTGNLLADAGGTPHRS